MVTSGHTVRDGSQNEIIDVVTRTTVFFGFVHKILALIEKKQRCVQTPGLNCPKLHKNDHSFDPCLMTKYVNTASMEIKSGRVGGSGLYAYTGRLNCVCLCEIMLEHK